MHLTFDGVNDAFEGIVGGIASGEIETVKSPSRVGDVLQIPEPLIVTYRKPRDRVLLNRYRDANPFFHLYEFLWMISGRNDIAPLDYYSSGYSKQVKDGESSMANGAYGYRWRHATLEDPYEAVEVDQLKVLIEHLEQNPTSRRAVLQMWNVEDDLMKIGSPVEYSKDVCCNLSVMFSIRSENPNLLERQQQQGLTDKQVTELWGKSSNYLDMTVTNRSNDICWGMLGANIVHFSFLQEYMACALGIEVGVYNQISNNAHVYTERFKPLEWLKEYSVTEAWTQHDPQPRLDFYKDCEFPRIPLVNDVQTFDREVCEFVENNQSLSRAGTGPIAIESFEPFLALVALPAVNAFHCYKEKGFESALDWCKEIKQADWRIACTEWIERRKAKWEKKNK